MIKKENDIQQLIVVLYLDIVFYVNDVVCGVFFNLCLENLVIFCVGKWYVNIIFLYDQYINCIF